MKKLFIGILCVVAMTGSSFGVWYQSYQNGYWGNTNMWGWGSPTGAATPAPVPPQSGDDVYIDVNKTVSLNVNSTVKSLTVGRSNGYGILNLNTAGTALTVTGNAAFGDASANLYPGTMNITAGALTLNGTTTINSNGVVRISGKEATSVFIQQLAVSSSGTLTFVLSEAGVTPVTNTLAGLSQCKLVVDGSAYAGGPTNFVLIGSSGLSSMFAAGNISITGLASATVVQVGNSVVLSVVESQTPVYFENEGGNGLWGTAGNWSSASVPTGIVNAIVGGGLTATVATNVPDVKTVTVGDAGLSGSTLIVQAGLATGNLMVGTQGPGLFTIAGSSPDLVTVGRLVLGGGGTLLFELDTLGVTPLTLAGDVSGAIVVDGTAYEGFDGYFPLILSSNLTVIATNDVTLIGFGAREPAVVLQADGLWLRVIAPPALSARLCSLVPDSTVAVDWSNTTFSASRAYEPSGSAWSLSLKEAHVMDTHLSQTVDDSSVRSWDLRVARGGNIYSLRTGALGETVPPSYRSDGDSSPWNDEVWQGVAVGPLNKPPDSPYFMHQSGVYLKDLAILKEPFYSPQVASHLNAAERSFTTINWTPQAHVYIYTDGSPTNDWKSYLLMYTRYRDLGQGVIEVSLGCYNYGPDLLNWFDMPWGGVRRTSTEYGFVSEPGGTSWSAPITNGWGTYLNFNQTGGWIGYSATSNGVTPALGFVVGRDAATLLPGQTRASWFGWGYAGISFASTNETTWRNYLVTTAVRHYNLTQGKGFWSRHYFVLGDNLADLSTRIASRNLVDAQLRAFNYTEATTPLVAYSVSGSGTTFRATENSRTPQFFLYAHPVSGSFPIFEVLENDNSRYLTWNPYANGIVKPYDGTIAGMRLLGFAMPSVGTNGTYAALSGFLPAENYLADGKTLYVRTATRIETWRVEYFGAIEDAGDGANMANPDSDPAANLAEYALGGNPTNPADVGYVPTFGTADESGTNFFEYVYARRRDAEARGLSYMVNAATNLISAGWSANGINETGTAVIDTDFEAVTNSVPVSDAGFVRLQVRLD